MPLSSTSRAAAPGAPSTSLPDLGIAAKRRQPHPSGSGISATPRSQRRTEAPRTMRLVGASVIGVRLRATGTRVAPKETLVIPAPFGG